MWWWWWVVVSCRLSTNSSKTCRRCSAAFAPLNPSSSLMPIGTNLTPSPLFLLLFFSFLSFFWFVVTHISLSLCCTAKMHSTVQFAPHLSLTHSDSASLLPPTSLPTASSASASSASSAPFVHSMNAAVSALVPYFSSAELKALGAADLYHPSTASSSSSSSASASASSASAAASASAASASASFAGYDLTVPLLSRAGSLPLHLPLPLSWGHVSVPALSRAQTVSSMCITVFSYLSPLETCHARLVCKSWNKTLKTQVCVWID
jgi:hypothetical protein